MKPVDPEEREVLENTLEAVRRARHRRRACQLAALPLLLVAGAGWLAMRSGPLEQPVPTVAVGTPEPPKVPAESLTVVEWKGGMPSLVEYSGEALGKLELSFTLDPVVAFPEEAW